MPKQCPDCLGKMRHSDAGVYICEQCPAVWKPDGDKPLVKIEIGAKEPEPVK